MYACIVCLDHVDLFDEDKINEQRQHANSERDNPSPKTQLLFEFTPSPLLA